MHSIVRAKYAAALFAVAASGAASLAVAQRASDFQGLKDAVSNRLLPFSKIENSTMPIVDCSWVDVETLNRDSGGSGRMQYIYNATYSWKLVPMNKGLCVFLAAPEQRGLSREDARVLLSAQTLTFSTEELRQGLESKHGSPVKFADELPTDGAEENHAAVPLKANGPVQLVIDPDGTMRSPTEAEKAEAEKAQKAAGDCGDDDSCKKKRSSTRSGHRQPSHTSRKHIPLEHSGLCQADKQCRVQELIGSSIVSIRLRNGRSHDLGSSWFVVASWQICGIPTLQDSFGDESS